MAQAIDETLSADGQTATADWPGGDGNFAAYGTFGSGTAKLQVSFDDGTTWIDAGSDATLTADGTVNFNFPRCQLRADLSGATSPTVAIHAVPIKDFVQ